MRPAPPSPDAAEVPGFTILSELGRGAMGVVYLAEEEALGRRVALKVLRGSAVDPAETRARFDREVRAAARVAHPNIVPVHSTGESGGRLWYSMQYVEGRSLDRLLRESDENRLPPARAARIVRDVALTLDAAHRAGVVHRDVKPGNIMLVEAPPPDVERATASGRLRTSWIRDGAGEGPVADRPLLVDFGLAFDARSSSLSLSGEMIGTPSHMSPEQFLGRREGVGPAADQWALGVILYECLTGRLPFPAHDLPTLARRVCEEEPVAPSRLEPDLDGELETILLKCLRKEPRDRYGDCAGLADDLSRWLREAPITARPPSRARRLRTWARHHRATAAVLGVLLVGGLATATVATVVSLGRSRRIARADTEAREHLAAGRYAQAEEAYRRWIGIDPDAFEPREGQERARAGQRVQEALGRFGEAQQKMEELREGSRRLEALRREAREGRRAPGGKGLGSQEARGSEPWWMREPAYHASVESRKEAERLTKVRAEIVDLLAAAMSLVDRAFERAGQEGAAAKARIDQGTAVWHMEEWRRALSRGDAEAAAIHAIAVAKTDPGPFVKEIGGKGVLEVSLVDADARAWLFRYEREDDVVPRGGPRLLPLPYDLQELVAIVPPRFPEEVASRLEGEDPTAIEPDTPSVAGPFAGDEDHVGTMAGPMARDRYARLLQESAYPLVTEDRNEVPLARGKAEVALPMGSYLLLARAPNRAEVRLPFEVLRGSRVSLAPGPLPASGDVPEGFVFVSGGRLASGAEVGPFLAGKFELTFADWWEFLNDPRTLREIDLHRSEGWRFVPRIEGTPMVPRNEFDGSFVPPPNPERPVAHVSLFDVAGYVPAPPGEDEPRDEQLRGLAERLARSMVAAPDAPWGYLRWRTERSIERARTGSGTEQRAMLFTLPTVIEWERMAGGADRRAFVYGDEREWLFFKGSRSRRTNPASEPVGLFPEDESVFGVRDLTGSVSEWTLDWKEVGSLFYVKGASWGSQDPDEDRILTRRALPGQPDPTVGVRLVVRHGGGEVIGPVRRRPRQTEAPVHRVEWVLSCTR